MDGLSEALDRLAVLLAGSPHNLVSRAERDRVRNDHIAEAEALAGALPLGPGTAWLDLGTGGGLPGLVLALCRPQTSWLLLDAREKKVAEVARFARELGATNVTVVAGRAETVAHDPAYRARFDGVVVQAVGRLDVVAELARGFLGDGGLLASVKGPTWADEMPAALQAAGTLALAPPTAVRVPSPTRASWLVTMAATGRAPAWVPRRPGVPKRNPLGDPEEGHGDGT